MFFKKASKFFIYLTAFLLIVLLAVKSGVAVINANQDRFYSWLSESFPTKFSASNLNLSFGLSGFVITVENLDSGFLATDKLSVHVNVWHSLINFKPKLDDLVAIKPTVFLHQEGSGHIFLGNINLFADNDNSDSPFLPETNINIKSARINITSAHINKPLVIKDIALKINHRIKKGQFSGKLLNYKQSQISANLSWNKEISLDGKVEVSAKQIPAYLIAPVISNGKILLNSGFVDLSGNININQNQFGNAKFKTKFHNVKIKNSAGELIEFTEFMASFIVRYQQGKHYIRLISDLPKIQQYKGFKIRVGLIIDSDISSIRVPSLSLINLKYISPFLEDANLKDTINSHSIKGEIKNLIVNLSKDKPAKYSFTVKSFELAKSKDYLGLANLNGDVKGTASQLNLKLFSDNLIVDSGLFAKPLQLGKLKVKVSGQLLPNNQWQIAANDLSINNELLSANLALKLKSIAEKPAPNIDLTGDFSYQDISKLKRFLPNNLSSNLTTWLGQAFKAGQITNGKVNFSGDLNQYPFKNKTSGTFLTSFDIKNANFNFDNSWPNLKNLNARLTINKQQLTIEAKDSQLQGVKFQNISAKINNLIARNPILRIKALTFSSLQNSTKLLLNSPVKKTVGQTLKNLALRGKAKVNLNLIIPLSKGEVKVAGSVDLARNSMYLKEANLPIKNISGKVFFSESEVHFKDISAQSFGGELKANMQTTIPFSKKDSQIVLKLEGKANSQALQQWAQFPLPDLSGSSSWLAKVTLNNSSINTLGLSLDFKNSKVYLPDVIDKPKGKNFDVGVDLNWDDSQFNVEILSSGLIKGYLEQKKKGWSGGIAIKQAPFNFDEDKLLINAQLDSIHLADWEKWYSNYATTKPENSSQQIELNIKANSLKLEDSEFKQFELVSTNNQSGWDNKISSNKLEGKIFIPDNKAQAVEINLSKLVLDADETTAPKKTKKTKKTNTTTEHDYLSREAKIRIKSMIFNDKDIGEARLNMYPKNIGAVISDISVNGKGFKLVGSGIWNKSSKRTRLNLSLNAEKLVNIMRTFSYEGKIYRAKTKAKIKLNWQGDPASFELVKLGGKVNINIEKGVLADIDSSSGKVFSFLGLQNFTSRLLSFNFSDLKEDGLIFDSIKGDFTINKGIIDTRNTKIAGDSVNVDFRGKSNLMTKTMDFRVEVNPRLSDTFPLVGGLYAGPVGVVVGFFISSFNKETDNRIDKNISQDYDLIGTWDKPIVKKL